MVPNSYNELLMRRTAFETWGYATDGVMVDYLITQDRDLLAGTYQEIFIKKFDAQFPDKIASYYEKLGIITCFKCSPT